MVPSAPGCGGASTPYVGSALSSPGRAAERQGQPVRARFFLALLGTGVDLL